MRRVLAACLALSCALPARAGFTAGVLEPVTAGVAAEARRLGLESAAAAPAGAAEESAIAAPAEKGGAERVADFARLRFLAWRAAARGASGVWFKLPAVDPAAYPEEWQALARVARELAAARPVLDEGAPASAPFAVPAGVLARSWTRGGRRYALLVNDGAGPAALDAGALAEWRALFAARSDPRLVLPACGEASCLPPGGVLWLEGRPLAGL